MREIKFRGKRVDNGEWVDGFLFKIRKSSAGFVTLAPAIQVMDYDKMTSNSYEVIPETVGQYTGLKDKDGKEIYEDDGIKEDCPRGNTYIVKRVEGGFAINTFQDQDPNFWESTADRQTSGYIKQSCTVIGNVHDNPELLKESTDGKD